MSITGVLLHAAGTTSMVPSYHVFEEDMARYRQDFMPYLPTMDNDHDYELFLPVSYHMNPANFPMFEGATQCSSVELDWYGTQPSYHFCGFYGRQCYEDGAWCQAHCASDLLQSFGNVSGHGGDTPSLRVSSYFTWYSKSYNQPVLSGFWSSAYDSAAPIAHAPCTLHPGMCDAGCADSGPADGTKAVDTAPSFGGCGNQRACGMFASCTLGSTTINHHWADEDPPGANSTLDDKHACEAAGYRWLPAAPPTYPARCVWQNAPDCTTGRCFDRGHIVPSGVAGQLFGRSAQTFTMCNIAAQTSILNECKWMYLEQAIACIGRYHLGLTLAGSLGPYTPSRHMSAVPRPASQWKLLFLPAGADRAADRAADVALVWIFDNDEEAEYTPSSYCGWACLERIEAGLGVRFPARVRNATFPTNATAAFLALLGPSEMAACSIERSTWTPDQPPPTHFQLASWGPWNLIHAQGSDAQSGGGLPHFPCPSQE